MTASSVYLHVPFCVAKCPYCAFASAALCSGDEEAYLRAVTGEISRRRAQAGSVKTLYIGGGTPTVLSPRAWHVLFGVLDAAFAFEDDAEVTIEANPGSLQLEHIRLWREWRVTRVSVGVQSFDADELRLLGRLHNVPQAYDAVAACRSAGFSVSLDLMFGLPGGTLRNWARTLREALTLRPHHISMYQLTLEPDTPFGEHPPGELSDGYAPYRYAQWLLPHKGYAQYEVASFARPGHESRHNLAYWEDEAYLGLGPSAWGYLDGTRYKNAPALSEYAKMMEERGEAVVYEERLEGESAARQAAVLALRTSRGINWKRFAGRHGECFAAVIRNDLRGFPADLVRCDETRAVLTPRGLRVGNRIWEELI